MAIKKEKKWPRIYIGPVRKDGLLTNMQVFADGYPEAVQQLISENSDLQLFFVPMAELSASVRELKTVGSNLNTKFHLINKTLGGL